MVEMKAHVAHMWHSFTASLKIPFFQEEKQFPMPFDCFIYL